MHNYSQFSIVPPFGGSRPEDSFPLSPQPTLFPINSIYNRAGGQLALTRRIPNDWKIQMAQTKEVSFKIFQINYVDIFKLFSIIILSSNFSLMISSYPTSPGWYFTILFYFFIPKIDLIEEVTNNCHQNIWIIWFLNLFK